MNLHIASTCLALAAFAPVLKADKFHLEDPAAADKVEGNVKTRAIEGVLIEKTDKTYRIRVVGGELTLLKSQVVKIESDSLTVAKIESMEKDRAPKVAAANVKRREIQAAEASVRGRDTADASSNVPEQRTLVIEVDFQGLLPGYTFRSYDPVLHRANLSGLRSVIEAYLREEVRRAAHRSDSR